MEEMSEVQGSHETDQLQSCEPAHHNKGCPSCIEKVFSAKTRLEIKKLLAFAFPAILSYILFVGLGFVCIMFAGHLGELELAAMTLGLSVVNVTAVSVGVGLGSALETLGSQAYGAKSYRLVGIVLQRSICVLMLACFPIFALWLHVEKLLLLLHQDREVARLCQKYVDIFMVALPFDYAYIILERYLQNQGMAKHVFYVGFVGNVLHVGIQFTGRYVFGAKFSVVAWSNAIAYILLALLMWGYIVWRKLHVVTWKGWSLECLMDWGSYIKFAVPGMFMICLEWWSFEGGAFLMGTIGELALAVHGMVAQLLFLMFMIPMGMSVAAGVRVGNALGRGDPMGAKHVVKVALGIICCTSSIVVIIVFACKDLIGYAFTSERNVLQLFSKTVKIAIATHLCDSLQGVGAGIVRGCGRQKIGVVINFISYDLIGLPLGICLSFLVDEVRGVEGLWWGLAFGLFVQAVCYLTLLWRQNWDKEAEKAGRRTEDMGQPNGDVDQDGRSVTADTSNLLHKHSNGEVLVNGKASVPIIRSIPASYSGRVGYKLANYDCVSVGELQYKPFQIQSLSKRASDMTPAEKRTLIVKRLVPLLFGLLLVIVSAVFRFTGEDPHLYTTLHNSTDLNISATANSTVFTPTPSYLLYATPQVSAFLNSSY